MHFLLVRIHNLLRTVSNAICMQSIWPIKSYGFSLTKCSNTLVIYCVCILHNMHSYENNLHVMEVEPLSTRPDDTTICFSSHCLFIISDRIWEKPPLMHKDKHLEICNSII